MFNKLKLGLSATYSAKISQSIAIAQKILDTEGANFSDDEDDNAPNLNDNEPSLINYKE